MVGVPSAGERRVGNPESPGLGSSLSDLEAENRQLKEQLEQMKADFSVQLMQMNERSEKITAQVGAYTPLVEDVLGLRVFDKAKSYLISWITLGGTTALIASIALFAGAWKYAVDLIDTKIKTLSEEQVGEIVKKEAEAQVVKYFKDHNDEYIGHVEQMTVQFIQRTNTAVQSKLGYGGSTVAEGGHSYRPLPKLLQWLIIRHKWEMFVLKVLREASSDLPLHILWNIKF